MADRQLDLSTASIAALVAEAARRADLRARGLPLHESPVERLHRVGAPAGPQATFLFRVPFDLLVPDNAKAQPFLRKTKQGRTVPMIGLTPRYRAAKRLLHLTFLEQAGDRAPLEGPCQLTCWLVEPDRRARDITNHAKLLCDALTGIAYADDHQLVQTRWIRATADLPPGATLLIEPADAVLPAPPR